MTALAHLALFGWIPLVLVAFLFLQPRVAVIAALAAGSLLLPVLSIPVPGPLDFGKPEVICAAVLIGIICFDPRRLLEYWPDAIDVFWFTWIAAGALSSLSNDLGGYDAFCVLLSRLLLWGVPYLVGVLYLGTRAGLCSMLWVLFLSGLAYVPLCLFEVRMSPQLHYMVYGMAQHAFDQTIRGGGYRPMVFMAHGLELSLWMGAATVAGYALWRTSATGRVQGFRLGPLVALVGVTLVLCKSTGAIFLTGLGLLLLSPLALPWLRLAVLLGMFAYLLLRMFGDGALENLLFEVSSLVSEERAGSLKFRFDNEAILLDRAWQRPWLGAGGWNFGSLSDPETGEPIPVTTDSYWIIAMATSGFLGCVGLVGGFWSSVFRFEVSVLRERLQPLVELTAASVITLMILADSLVNAFIPPLYVAIAVGLTRAASGDGPVVAPLRVPFLRPRSAAGGLQPRVPSGRPWRADG
ncbi:MAG: hypothetical protein MUC36_01500 [Planctomycetes bacterium]|jgi:hypothetical protein|nr:hypothetical protein [Planctomycetota bacterium]